MTTRTQTSPLPVLLIEDEPAVMAYVRAALERNGYTVVCTESGVDGLRLLESGEFLGVVSDMRTPGGVDGADVHAWVEATSPGTGGPHGFHHRRYRQRRNRCHAARNRRSLRGEAFPRSAIHFGRGTDYGEGTVS